MKISIGTKIKEGPWGGGNLFAKNLISHLESNNHTVVNSLEDDDIDLILITEPRKTSESSAFTHVEVSKYVQAVKNDCLVVHRINECDERKNTNFVNQYLIEANQIADYTVFVSKWLKNLFISQGMKDKNKLVILSGANNEIFNVENHIRWDGKTTLKIVTHHWGAHWNKGFETYKALDKLLGEDKYKNKLEFTYIGNLPKKFKFQNSKVVKPLSGHALADELKKNHVYLTGSVNEPSGNHHIEGAQCGLPLLFLDSGGTTEYSQDYGVKFNEFSFESAVDYILKNYEEYKLKIQDYPFDAKKMSFEYEKLFLEMLSSKEDILFERSKTKNIGFFDLYIYKLSRKLNNFSFSFKN